MANGNDRWWEGGERRRVILDTDTWNEIDDQFALTYCVLAQEMIDLVGVTAAPFLNERSESAEDGMEKSFGEAKRILGLMGRDDVPVMRGSREFLVNSGVAERSDATDFLIEESKEGDLVVVAIGAPTNVANAAKLDEGFLDRVKVIWLGSHADHWPDTKEFNFFQDRVATDVLWRDGRVVVVPCMGVVSHLSLTLAEARVEMAGKSDVADALLRLLEDEVRPGAAQYRIIWDLAAVALLTVGGGFRVERRWRRGFDDDFRWTGERICEGWVVEWCDRAAVFGDLFRRLS